MLLSGVRQFVPPGPTIAALEAESGWMPAG